MNKNTNTFDLYLAQTTNEIKYLLSNTAERSAEFRLFGNKKSNLIAYRITDTFVLQQF